MTHYPGSKAGSLVSWVAPPPPSYSDTQIVPAHHLRRLQQYTRPKRRRDQMKDVMKVSLISTQSKWFNWLKKHCVIFLVLFLLVSMDSLTVWHQRARVTPFSDLF
ncbi:hypothetical protein NQD34_007473 [Periophthalmus magnuspinnatus]|nr:hypothetical protein NQD34_007473 [Periophthalmus magnuspinnatus]